MAISDTFSYFRMMRELVGMVGIATLSVEQETNKLINDKKFSTSTHQRNQNTGTQDGWMGELLDVFGVVFFVLLANDETFNDWR